MSTRRIAFYLSLAFLIVLAIGAPIRSQYIETAAAGTQSILAGRNVNMISGTKLPFGDPWLQRQNEPSLATSTRNPMHLLAGANDYRTIDVPDQFELPGIEAAANAHDAWLGVYESFDGGQSWISMLLPGYPQDSSTQGQLSPLRGYQTACDPIVRAGANGLFYYCGIAFDRDKNKSAIFVARYQDDNNLEKVEVKVEGGVRKYFGPIRYIDTRLVATGSTSSSFIDMPNMAVDIPRRGALYGNIYVAYTVFSSTGADRIFFQKSTDGGVMWGAPVQLSTTGELVQRPTIAVDPLDLTGKTIYVAFRRFASGSASDGIVVVRSTNGGNTFSKLPDVASSFYPFDQGTDNSPSRFRTNSYPTMAVGDLGTVYVAWSQRQGGPTGQARIMISVFRKGGLIWTTPKVVDATYAGIGHQFMPSLTFAAWKLMLAWYDQREDEALDSSPFIGDSVGEERHTIDIRVAEGRPGVPPSFGPSVQLSRYLYVLDLDSSGNPIEEDGYYRVIKAESNPINYPLFQMGTVPFHGDYIEITPSIKILPPAIAFGFWIYNINPLEPTLFHAAWTDNRDVRPPNGNMWGDWVNYSAPNSIQDDGWEGTYPCSDGSKTGMRNQNIYTANINKGLIMGSPGNTKQLDLPLSGEGGRTFVVFVKNTTEFERTLRLVILQIGGVNASFDQFEDDNSIQVRVQPYSSVSTTVYVDRSTKTLAPMTVNAFEGLKLVGYVVLNPDPTNLPLNDPDNPFENLGKETHDPDVSAPLVWNYDLGDESDPNAAAVLAPRVHNPRVHNDSVVNQRLQNEGVLNPRVHNESIVNNEVSNPRVHNALEPNAALTDVTWTVTNEGNTTSVFTVNIQSPSPDYFNGDDPPLIAQVLVYKANKVPVDKDCQLYETHQDELMANVSNPRVHNAALSGTALGTQGTPMSTQAADLTAEDITFYLAPGEQADVIFRVWDEDTTDGSPTFDPDMVIAEAVAEAVNTEDVEAGSTTPSYDTPPNDEPWTTPSPAISTSPTALSFSATLGGDAPSQMLDIWNSGGENLSYTIDDDADWLSVYPTSGTSTGGLNFHSVSVDTYGLAVGSYAGTITVRDPLASNNPLKVPVTLTISELPPPSGEWLTRYNGPANLDDNAATLATDSAGNVYVVGTSIATGTGQDILTIKYNPAGSVVWIARYDAGHSAPNNNESPTAIAVDPSGNVIVTGTQQDGAYSNYDWITIKYSSLGTQLWAVDYDGNAIADDVPRAMVVDSAGNAYVTGESPEAPSVFPDFLTLKYSPAGDQVWESRYAGLGGSDMAKALALDSLGNVYVAGTSSGLYGNFDYALVKYDSSGIEQWDRTHDGTANGNDQVSVLAVDASNYVYVGGSSEGSTGSFDYCTIKFDSFGEVEWIRRYDRVGGHDLLNAMAVDSSGNVYVTGRSDYGLGLDPISDYATIKYDNSGTQQWVALYDGPDQVQDVARAIAIDPAGNVYIAGESDGPGTSFDFATIKHDGNGNEVWVRRYNGPGNFNDSAAAVVIDPEGNVLITGSSTGSGTGMDFATIKYKPALQEWVALAIAPYQDVGSNSPKDLAVDSSGNVYVTGSLGGMYAEDYATIKYNASGSQQWMAIFDGAGNYLDQGRALALDSSGNVYVTGIAWDWDPDDDFGTIKYDAGGNEQWVRLYNGTGNANDVAEDMAVDSSGNVYVTGSSEGYGTGGDFATVKYASDGTPQWEARYDSPGHGSEGATAIAVGSSGHVFVTGKGIEGIVTVKYAASDGSEAQVATHDGGGANAMAMDSSGNVFVTGSSYGSGTGEDYIIIKYDANLNELNVATYNGPGNGMDRPLSIAVDSSGNVYVTGRSMGSESGEDYATVKYDNDLNEQWVARYNGPGNDNDYAYELAVDSSENVYVTGASYGIRPSPDFTTIKYDANGKQLWVARYCGSGNYNSAHGLAVDSAGTVYVTGYTYVDDENTGYATLKYRHTPSTF